MDIENSKATSRAKFWLIRMPLLSVLVLLVLTMMEVLSSPVWLIISAGVFLITLLVVLIGRFNYVKIFYENGELTIRHYNIFPLISDFQELVIQKSETPEFILKRTFFGMVPVLYVQVETYQGTAVYPPIPLSLLNRDEMKTLTSALGLE